MRSFPLSLPAAITAALLCTGAAATRGAFTAGSGLDPSSGSPSTDEADEGAYAVVQAELPRPSPAPCPLRVTLTRTAMTQRPLLPGAEGGYPCVSEKYAHHLLLQELSLEMVPRAILYRVPI